jgi:nucleoid DNA-binding protein
MQKEKLIEKIASETKSSKEKVSLILNQLFVSRAIPTVIQDKVFMNIAEGADAKIDEARRVVNSFFGFLAEQPKLFEVMSEQLVSSWINDCDGCNNCASKGEMLTPRVISESPMR